MPAANVVIPLSSRKSHFAARDFHQKIFLHVPLVITSSFRQIPTRKSRVTTSRKPVIIELLDRALMSHILLLEATKPFSSLISLETDYELKPPD